MYEYKIEYSPIQMYQCSNYRRLLHHKRTTYVYNVIAEFGAKKGK